MKKVYITVNADQLRDELGLPKVQGRPPARRADGDRIRGAQPARAPNPFEDNVAGIKKLDTQVHFSRDEAQAFADNFVRMRPESMCLVFELVEVLETVPSTPIRKRFNEVGELIVT